MWLLGLKAPTNWWSVCSVHVMGVSVWSVVLGVSVCSVWWGLVWGQCVLSWCGVGSVGLVGGQCVLSWCDWGTLCPQLVY